MTQLQDVLQTLEGYFDEMVELLYKEFNENVDELKYFLEVLKYNLSEGKKMRGLLVVLTYKEYVKLGFCDGSLLKEAFLVAWAVEILQAAFLVLDDIADNSPLRRGLTSWFMKQKKEGLGLISINDGMHLYICVQNLVMNIFEKDDKMLLKMLRLFQSASFTTCFGQCADMRTSLCERPSAITREDFVKTMSVTKNSHIIQTKTAYYTFYLPLALGMTLAGVSDSDSFERVKCISFKLGEYFQIQDDYLDAFGDREVLGKEGTDIQEGKCTWLICQAVLRAEDSQLNCLVEHYGKKGDNHVEVVKSIYRALNLSVVYDDCEKTLNEELRELISRHCTVDSSSAPLPVDLFNLILSLLYKRKK